MLSRRQVLTSATYGLGATLLFGRSLAEPADGHRARGAALIGEAATDDGTGSAAIDADLRASAFASMRLGEHGQPRSACKGRRGVVVVGVDDDGAPVSWMNEGDTRWHERTLRRPAPGAPEVWGVAAHGDRFVAVGSMLQQEATAVVADDTAPEVDDPVTYSSRRRRPTIWWTRDSLEWHGHLIEGVDERHAQLIAVSGAGTLLVAVGSTLDADGVQGDGALVMTSTDDGETWRRGDIAPGETTLAEGSFTGVTHAGGRWLATSTDIDGGTVWRSTDGRTWSTLRGSAQRFRGITLQGIGVHAGGVYVAGTTLTDQRPRYFASSDQGATWHDLRRGPKVLTGSDSTVNDLTVMSGEVVVVGTSEDRPVIEGGAPDAAN